MPRNWQPPPGVPQARQPRSAASDSVTNPWANRVPRVCTAPASSPDSGGSVTPPGTSDAGEVAQPRQRHHHRGQALVAGGDAQHTGANGQRPRQPPQHDCGVVPIRQAVKHARRALRSPVAGVRAESREGDGFQPAKFLGGRLHEQADFPMAGMVAQSDGFAIRRPQPALGAQNEKLLARNLSGSPAHAGVLCQPKQITARACRAASPRSEAACPPGPAPGF